MFARSKTSDRIRTPLWRGSALAYPLIDATFLPGNPKVLCGLHRGDSFIQPDPASKETRVLAYQWNGFGFSGMSDKEVCKKCKEYFNSLYTFD